MSFYVADPAGLQAAYGAPATSAAASLPYRRDGLLLLHRGAHYALGHSPLALAWKDAACSAYAVDTDHAGNVPPLQPLVLRLLPCGGAATGDEPPVVLLASLADALQPGDATSAAAAAAARPGALLRFDVLPDGGGLTVDGAGRLAAPRLRFRGSAARRGEADTVSKARRAGGVCCCDVMSR